MRCEYCQAEIGLFNVSCSKCGAPKPKHVPMPKEEHTGKPRDINHKSNEERVRDQTQGDGGVPFMPGNASRYCCCGKKTIMTRKLLNSHCSSTGMRHVMLDVACPDYAPTFFPGLSKHIHDQYASNYHGD